MNSSVLSQSSISFRLRLSSDQHHDYETSDASRVLNLCFCRVPKPNLQIKIVSDVCMIKKFLGAFKLCLIIINSNIYFWFHFWPEFNQFMIIERCLFRSQFDTGRISCEVFRIPMTRKLSSNLKPWPTWDFDQGNVLGNHQMKYQYESKKFLF